MKLKIVVLAVIFSAVSAPTPLSGQQRTVPCQLKPSAERLSFADSLSYLKRQAPRILRRVQIRAHDGTVVYAPGYQPGLRGHDYGAFWVRDFTWMVEGDPDGIPRTDIRDGMKYLIRGQRSDGAMPDRVRRDGTPVYRVAGPHPVSDGPQMMVKLIYRYTRLTGNHSLFSRYSRKLELGMDWVRDRRRGAVYIPPQRAHSPGGVVDGIAHTGIVLFPSLLWVEASRKMGRLFGETGRRRHAKLWRRRAARAERQIDRFLYDRQSGMYLAGSIDNRQIDVPGSAYAAFANLVAPGRKVRIARYLAANYRRIAFRGQVRNLPKPAFWDRTFGTKPGFAQNGGYWAWGSGWVATTLALADRPRAMSLIRSLVADFRANGINEFIAPDAPPDMHCIGFGNYGLSATLPLQGARMLAAN